MNIIVCVKQIPDPETPAASFKVDEAAKKVIPAQGIAPVVNPFDPQATEAALRLKDAAGDGRHELFKTSKDIQLAEGKRERLAAAGDAIAKARVIEVDNEISRLNVAAQGYRQELRNRGLSDQDITAIADGKLLSEISVVVPPRGSAPPLRDTALATPTSSEGQSLAYELRELNVEYGEQVQAGQTLCHLSSHQLLAIEGRAFLRVS